MSERERERFVCVDLKASNSHSVHDFIEQNAICQVFHTVHCVSVIKSLHLLFEGGWGVGNAIIHSTISVCVCTHIDIQYNTDVVYIPCE